MTQSCPRCYVEPCTCALQPYEVELSPEAHARAEMVRRHLPWGALLTEEQRQQRDNAVTRLESLQPKHLPREQLLELYLLELLENVRREAPRVKVTTHEQQENRR